MTLQYQRLEDAIVANPGRLILDLDRNLFGGQALLKVMKPGQTERSKPVDILGAVIVGDEGQTHADLLEMFAGALRRADEIGQTVP